MFGPQLSDILPDPVWTIPTGYAERAEYAKQRIAAMDGIERPLEFRAAVEELRAEYHHACRIQPRSSLSALCTRIERLISLLPAMPGDK